MSNEHSNQSYQLIAHRGLPQDYPENTLIGYQHAFALPIDMLEIDIHYTKDKQLVVIHDDTIDRTSNGKGKVKDYTLEELKNLILVLIMRVILKANKFQHLMKY